MSGLSQTPQKRILVVEDHEDSQEMMVMMLAARGYSVGIADSGAAAMEVLRQDPLPDLIVLDLMIPMMSGWDVLDGMRADVRLRHIPVVVVTALTGRILRERPLVADAVMIKPLNYDEFFATVDRLIGSASV